MSQSLLLAFVMFATVMFFTPGPNNIMLLSSGLTYGFRPTIPHIMGITIGFAFMVGAVGVAIVVNSHSRFLLRGRKSADESGCWEGQNRRVAREIPAVV